MHTGNHGYGVSILLMFVVQVQKPCQVYIYFLFFSQEVSFELISAVLCLQGTVSAAFVHKPAAVWVDTEEKSCPGMEIAM